MTRLLHNVILALLGIILSFAVHAQGTWSQAQLTLAYMPHGYMNYQYLLLNYTGTGTKSPLLVYEHENTEGSGCYVGGSCTQLSQPLASGGAGPQDWYNNAGFQARYCANGCIIVMPYADQNSDLSGQTSNFGGYGDTPGSQPNELGVAALIHYFLNNFNADPNRIYVTGDSLGGIGSWAMALDYNYLTGSVEKLVTATMPFAGNISRGSGLTNSQTAQVTGGGFIFAINGTGDTTSSNPVNWTSPLWQAITGNTNFPGPPAGGVAGSSPYHYLLDTTLGHDVWDTYRPLPTGQPMLDMLFAQVQGSGGPGGGGGGLSGTPKSVLPSGYLHTTGNQIIDGLGNNVRLACNGYNEPTGNYASDMSIMRNQGFNCVRVDYYDATTCPGGSCNFGTLDAIVGAAQAAQMKVVITHHGNEGVDGNNGCLSQQSNGLWYDVNGPAPWNAIGSVGTDGCGTPGTVSYAQFKANWLTIANHYRGNSTVIGFDLHNEPTTYGNTCCGSNGPYGVNWGSGNGADIKAMFNDVGAAIEAADPGVLIIAEGVINNGTLFNGTARGSAAFPITSGPSYDLSTAQSNPISCCSGQVVYSVHEYPTSIGGIVPDSGPASITMRETAWGFLVKNNFAPIFVGEMGASLDGSNGAANLADEQAWATDLTQMINGQKGGDGGPTFTGCQQPISTDWWNFGYLPGQIPDGTLNADGSSKSGQQAFWSTLLYTTCSGASGGGATRSAYLHPGGNGSVYNTPFGDGATWSAAGDAQTLSICGPSGQTPPSCVGIINTTASYGQTKYTGAAGDSTYTFNASSNGRTVAPDNGPTLSATLHVPTGAITPGPYPGDNGFIIQDPTNYPNRMYYFGLSGINGIASPGVQPGQGPFAAGQGEWEDITSNQFGEDYDTGNSGYQVGAGLITGCDTSPTCNPVFPKIQHGLRAALDAAQFKSNATPTTGQILNADGWPDRLQDAQSGINVYTGNLPFGHTLGIPLTDTMPGGLDANCQGLYWTMQHYPVIPRDQAGGGLHLTVDQIADTSSWATSARSCLGTLVGHLRVLTNQHQGGQDFITHPKNGPGNRTDSGPLPLGGGGGGGGGSGGGATPTVWNPSDSAAGITLTNTNQTATASGGPVSVRSTTSQSTGKKCWEETANTLTGNFDVGLASAAYSLTAPGGLGSDSNGIGFDPLSTGGNNGIFFNNSVLSFGPGTSTSGDKLTQCADFDAKLYWATSGAMRAAGYTWNSNTVANPATGVGGLSFAGMTCPCFITFNTLDTGSSATLNAAGPFAVATPTTFNAWQLPINAGGQPKLLIFGENEKTHTFRDWRNMLAFSEPMDLTR